MRFLISPDGKVSQSGVAVSSLRNGAVESCVSQVVQRIRFPPPQQLVAVRYPSCSVPSAVVFHVSLICVSSSFETAFGLLRNSDKVPCP